MIGFIAGYSDTDDISYCPFCGERIYERYADGTARCEECEIRFGVVEKGEED